MKVIIFYGTDCDENTAWIPWLKNELIERGIECIIPPFPTPQNQTYKNWKIIADKSFIKNEDIVVAWSTGAIFAVRYLFEKGLKVNKLITISGFNNYIGNIPSVDNLNKDFFIEKLDKAKNIANKIICFKSDNDPFISQEALNNFANELNATTINIKNGGHFNKNAGYNKFTELLKVILD